jgi:PleD family two-component response regulator
VTHSVLRIGPGGDMDFKLFSGRTLTKILVVDDDPFMHLIFRSIIDETRFSMVAATNVSDATRMIKNSRPDIIVTDVMMPDESGLSLINKLKCDRRTSDIPIILMTILDESDSSVMYAMGLVDFCVGKPLHLSDMKAVIEQAARLAEQRSSIPVRLWDAEPEIVTVIL